MDETEEINRLYYEQKMSLRQIAKLTKHNIDYVKIRLEYGIRDRREALLNRSTPEYSEKLRATQLGERNNSAKLTAEKVMAIRREYDSLLGSYTKTQAQYFLARKYSVKRPTISDIVLKRTWKHI